MLNVIMTFRGGVSDRDVINYMYVYCMYVYIYIMYLYFIIILYVCYALLGKNMILCQYIVLLT